MLTRRMQLAAIWRLIDGSEELEDSALARFSPDLRQAYYVALRWLGQGPDTALAIAARSAAGDEDAAADLIDDIRRAGDLYFPSLDEIAANLTPVSWLWPNWIPRGMISLLGATQGTGKSYLALDLARIITAGDRWPDGAGVADRGRVVYVEGEGVPQITLARADLLGIDKRALVPMLGQLDNTDLIGAIDFGRQIWRDELADMVHVVKPELVIVDSFSSVNGRGQNAVEDVNGILIFLAGLASAHNCGILIIHHLRKPSAAAGVAGIAEVNIHDFRGSGHITAMARTVLGLSVLASGYSLDGPRRLRVVKSNLADYPPALAVAIEESADGRKRFTYRDAEDADDSKRDTCAEWLVQFLELEGPTKPTDIVAAGTEEGYSRPTIYRARKALGGRIENTDGRQSPVNRWRLAEGNPAGLDDFGVGP